MGLVPWVRRDAQFEGLDSPAGASAGASAGADDTARTPLECRTVVPSTHNAQSGFVHDPGAATLLLVFDERFGHTDVSLNSADNQLLLDMLKAIQLDDSSVARCLLAAAENEHTARELRQQLAPSIQAVLHLVGESTAIASDDELASRQVAENLSVPVWCLPHPHWIQQQPLLKRRAWNVLKAVKVVLNEHSVV